MDDITRLRKEYSHRKKRLTGTDVYSWFNKANLFTLHQRQRATLAVLKKNGFSNLPGISILEMGCGGGGVMSEFLEFGEYPENLYGVDLLFDGLLHAHHVLPGSVFANADGQNLPFPARRFDLVMQFTALSSILDPELRQNICADMMRVLKPDGMILWYDFWLNPTNPQTHGVRPAEIRRLFPNCSLEFHKITLAPPIARRVVPISWMLALFLENLKIFNSHYLVAIRPLITDDCSPH
jgi:ubiquinone/menaquinone biosynthesis C-methylase UbiE